MLSLFKTSTQDALCTGSQVGVAISKAVHGGVTVHLEAFDDCLHVFCGGENSQ